MSNSVQVDASTKRIHFRATTEGQAPIEFTLSKPMVKAIRKEAASRAISFDAMANIALADAFGVVLA